jgi:hypothetical protein
VSVKRAGTKSGSAAAEPAVARAMAHNAADPLLEEAFLRIDRGSSESPQRGNPSDRHGVIVMMQISDTDGA